MYKFLIGAMLVFPWILAIHIALGAFRDTRRRAIANKQGGEGGAMKRSSAVSRQIWFVGVPVLVLVATALVLSAEAHAPGVALSGFGTVTIDGVLSPGEWDDAACIDFPVNIPEGGTTPGTVCAMNDEHDLYLAIRFARTVVDPENSAAFEFDNDHSGGPRVSGDEALLLNPDPTVGFFDEVRTTEPPCLSGTMCGFVDTSLGGTNDGDRKSTRLNSSHIQKSRMPSSA